MIKSFFIASLALLALTGAGCATTDQEQVPVPQIPKINQEAEIKKAADVKIIDVNDGPVILSSIEYSIIESAESQEVRYEDLGRVRKATEGAKLIRIKLSIKNTGKETLSLPSEAFLLVDNLERKYSPLAEIGLTDDELTYKSLSPGIPQKGSLIYEVPIDSASYSMITCKAGTNECYRSPVK